MTKVAIVEDDKSYNMALKKIINHSPLFTCVGQFYNGSQALENLPKLSPDVVIMDIRLPDTTGIELVKEIKPKINNTQFVMCTSSAEDEMVFDSLKAGASGYLLKGEDMNTILNAIKQVADGGTPFTNSIARRVLNYFTGLQKTENEIERLTKTEYEVLECLAKGMMYKEIAEYKNVTIDTIKKHVCNLYKKLHVNNKIEAINKLNKK